MNLKTLSFGRLLFFMLSIFLLSCSSEKLVKINTFGDLPNGLKAENTPKAEDYPEDDAVVLYENEETDVDYLGGIGLESYRTHHKVVKVFRNVDNFKKMSIYIGEDDELEFFSARSIDPDGIVHTLKMSEIYVSNVEMKTTEYNKKKKFVKFSFPNVKKNSIIEYKIKRISRGAYISRNWQVQHYIPVIYSKFTISMPKWMIDNKEYGWNWQYKAYNIKNFPKPVTDEGFGEDSDRSYSWEMRNIPAYRDEPMDGNREKYEMYVDFNVSGWKNWNDVARYEKRKNIKPVYKITDKVKSKAKEIIGDAKTEEEKIARLYLYAQKITYDMTHNFFGRGQRPETPERVIEKQYGDCKDKATLLTALLESIGVKAHTALVLTKGYGEISDDMPTLNFNHMIVQAVSSKGKKYWLDPTARFESMDHIHTGISGRKTLVLKLGKKSKKLETIPETKPEDELTKKDIKISFNENGKADVKVTFTVNGDDNISFRNSLFEKSDYKKMKFARGLVDSWFYNYEIKDIKHSEIENMKGEFTFSFTIKDCNLLVKSGDFHMLYASDNFFLRNTSGYWGWMYRKSRKHTIEFYSNYSFDESLEITFPENIEIVALPENVKYENKKLGLTIVKNFNRNGNKVTLTQSCSRGRDIYEAKEYDELKKLITNLKGSNFNTILLKKKDSAETETADTKPVKQDSKS